MQEKGGTAHRYFVHLSVRPSDISPLLVISQTSSSPEQKAKELSKYGKNLMGILFVCPSEYIFPFLVELV